MNANPGWLKPKEKPYFHQISLDCLEKLVECIKRFNKGEIDADTSFKQDLQGCYRPVRRAFWRIPIYSFSFDSANTFILIVPSELFSLRLLFERHP